MGCKQSKVTTDHSKPMQSSHHNMSTKAGMSLKDSHRFSLRLDVADGSVSIKTLTFRHVMKDPLGREYFMKFLKTEHAEENLVFFDEVEVFKATKLKAATNIKEAVEDMVATYLMPGVESEVNISDQMKRNLLKAATNDVEHHLEDFLTHLDKAQNEIMMILAMGAFPRFIKSKLFIQYKIKAKEIRDKEEEDEVRTAEGASA